MAIFLRWFWAVVVRHGWWRFNPRKWQSLDKNRFEEILHFEKLPEKYKKRGDKVHSIQCKICKEKWFTSYPKPLCNKLKCWIKYERGKLDKVYKR